MEANGHVANGTGGPELPPVTSIPLDPRLVDPHGILKKGFVWPGRDGVPFRGAPPDIKKSDPKQPEIGTQVFVERLDLAEPVQFTRYQQICQIVGNGYGQISFEERKYDEKSKNWVVLLRWMLNYSYMPKGS